MLALNILLDAPGEFGCVQDWKTRRRTKLSKSLAFFLSGNVVGRKLGQLAGLRFQSCSQLVEQPLTLVMKGLHPEMLSAQQPLEHWLLKGGTGAPGSESSLLFVVSERTYWIRIFEIGAPESVFPRLSQVIHMHRNAGGVAGQRESGLQGETGLRSPLTWAIISPSYVSVNSSLT